MNNIDQITVGTKIAEMGDTGHGEPVIVDTSRATVWADSDVCRMPVTSHRCDCGGELYWDDGTAMDAMPGVCCENSCGYAFGTDEDE